MPTGADIPDYVPSKREGAMALRIGKNAKYTIKMLETPKGVHVIGKIMQHLQKLQYNDHDILAYPECMKDTHMETLHGPRGPITREPTQWALGLQRSLLLSISQILQFGTSTEVNACVKQLLDCFHG